MSASETHLKTPTPRPAKFRAPHPECGLKSGDDERSRRILSLASVLTYSRSPAGARPHTSACDNTRSLFGWEPGQLVTDPELWRGSLHPEDAPGAIEALESLSELGECSVEYRLRCSDGKYLWFRDSMALLHDADGKPAEIIGCLQDISRTKELERELREALLVANAASQAKSDFLANMSHELITPLNSVIGFSEVLLDRFFGELTAKQDEYVNTIRAAGQQLLFLLNDILQLARLDAGNENLDLALASPAGLLRLTLEMNREKAMRHNIALELVLGAGMEQEMLLDEVKFRQVLFALLGNAVKFSPDGGRVRLSGRLFEKGGESVLELGVEDSGPGIAEEFAPRLFTAFSQQERPQTKTHQGAGLGLALARRLARLQGGDVELAATSAQGSRVVFTLPVRAHASGAAGEDREPAPEGHV